MLEDFVLQNFNGDRQKAIECIANELSDMKYKVTGNMENCRSLASELSSDEKNKAMEYFKQNKNAFEKEQKRLEKFKITYDEARTAVAEPKYRTYLITAYLLFLVNFQVIFQGLTPFESALPVFFVPPILVGTIKKLLMHKEFDKMVNYVHNADILKTEDDETEPEQVKPLNRDFINRADKGLAVFRDADEDEDEDDLKTQLDQGLDDVRTDMSQLEFFGGKDI